MFHSVTGQNMTIQWQNCFGGSDLDYASDMVCFNNYYYVAGGSVSNDGDITYNHGNGDGWLIKTDDTGMLVWEKTYGGTNGEYWLKILSTLSNNYFLLGSSNSSDGDITYDPYHESVDFWIIKIDSNGVLLWDKIVGGTGGDWLTTGITTTDGGVVAIGYTNSEDGDISVHYGMYDMWMVKLNSSGNIEWDFTLGNNYMDYPDAIIQTTDGGFLVGGSSKITEGGNINCESHGQADGILVKLDSLRNIEWQQCYGGSDYDGIIGLVETETGYIFTGYVNSNDGDITGWHGENDFWIVSIDKSGNINWQNSLGGSRSEMGNNVFKALNGVIYAIGNTQSNDGDVSGNHTLSEYDTDIWIVKLNVEGELLSQQCIGGIGNEELDFGAVKKTDSNFVIAGRSNKGPSYDVSCDIDIIQDNYNFWVFEINDSTLAVPENRQIAQLKVYPNPANDYVMVEIPGFNCKKTVETKIQILNLYGQEVVAKQMTSETAVIDLSTLKDGIYFYQVEIEGQTSSGKFVVQH